MTAGVVPAGGAVERRQRGDGDGRGIAAARGRRYGGAGRGAAGHDAQPSIGPAGGGAVQAAPPAPVVPPVPGAPPVPRAPPVPAVAPPVPGCPPPPACPACPPVPPMRPPVPTEPPTPEPPEEETEVSRVEPSGPALSGPPALFAQPVSAGNPAKMKMTTRDAARDGAARRRRDGINEVSWLTVRLMPGMSEPSRSNHQIFVAPVDRRLPGADVHSLGVSAVNHWRT